MSTSCSFRLHSPPNQYLNLDLPGNIRDVQETHIIPSSTDIFLPQTNRQGIYDVYL